MVAVVLTIINLICIGGTWYFYGRSTIYVELIKDYKQALTIIGKQQAIIEAYKRKYESKETEKENGEQD